MKCPCSAVVSSGGSGTVFFPGNAQVDRGKLLQNRALFRILQKTPAKPCPTAIFQCNIALCDLCLMGMD